jgi:hypothetical protein
MIPGPGMYKGEIIKRVLGPTGEQFVFSSIREYGESLLQLVAEDAQGRGVEAFAFVPADVDEKVLAKPEGGGYYIPSCKSWEAQVRFICEYLRKDAYRCCVMEMRWECHLHSEEGLQSRWKYFEKEVYSLCLNGDKAKEVELAFGEAEQPALFLGILSSFDSQSAVDKILKTDSFTPEMLACLAKATEYVFTCAWDGEGYVNMKIIR